MSVPSFNDIRYFIDVAETGNISRAAERLGITQPSLSLSVKRLEDSLGTALLLRSKNGIKLTQAGKRFLSESKDLLNRWNQVKSNTKKTEDEVSGQYSLGCHQTVALYTLKHFLPELLEKNPQLEIKLKHDISRKITEEIISFSLDFGIVINPVKHPDLVLHKLGEDEFGFWKSKKHDLKKMETLIYDPDLNQSLSLLKRLTKKNINFIKSIHCNSLEVISTLASEGVGVALLPKKIARQNPQLELLSEDYPSVMDEIYLVYRSDLQKGLARRTLVDTISSQLKKALK